MHSRQWLQTSALIVVMAGLALSQLTTPVAAQELEQSSSAALRYSAPAGNLPTTRQITIDGLSGAVLPNGRFITPPGVEVNVGAPKPFGMALSPNGNTLATINSGIGPFSITLITNLKSSTPSANLIQVNASFLGVVFSPDSSRFYAFTLPAAKTGTSGWATRPAQKLSDQ